MQSQDNASVKLLVSDIQKAQRLIKAMRDASGASGISITIGHSGKWYIDLDYGSAFVDKHEPEIGPAAATYGGMAIGFMRAILECDYCPGVFRIPQDEDWNELYCPSCGRVWIKKAEDK